MMTLGFRWPWVHGVSPQIEASTDGCLIWDHQV
jgi:hypothetical protein